MYKYVYIVILVHLCRYDGSLSEMQVDFVHWSLKFDLFSSAYQWITLYVTQTNVNVVRDYKAEELYVSKRDSREDVTYGVEIVPETFREISHNIILSCLQNRCDQQTLSP